MNLEHVFSEDDTIFMGQALDLAKKAAELGEVPVGAVLVLEGRVIGRGWNLRETRRSPLEHAEIMAIREASENINAWRLAGAKLYVTLEPCLMCAGAITRPELPRLFLELRIRRQAPAGVFIACTKMLA
jgi:tRNA(adenine34) deaminase